MVDGLKVSMEASWSYWLNMSTGQPGNNPRLPQIPWKGQLVQAGKGVEQVVVRGAEVITQTHGIVVSCRLSGADEGTDNTDNSSLPVKNSGKSPGATAGAAGPGVISKSLSSLVLPSEASPRFRGFTNIAENPVHRSGAQMVPGIGKYMIPRDSRVGMVGIRNSPPCLNRSLLILLGENH